jgi:hypothetical protein
MAPLTEVIVGLVLAAGTLGVLLVIVGLSLDSKYCERPETGHDRAERREWQWYWNKDRKKELEKIPSGEPLS